jgi:hypothetical protein
MGRAKQATGWKRLFRHMDAPGLKRWYRKYIHRKNRRAARLDPLSTDKKLDPWEVD